MKHGLLVLMSACVMSACGVKVSEDSDKVQPEFNEKHRPQFHFTPPANWMNDPNGMVYYEGEYHLFYQYYPDSNVWGPMHWGHAVSSDMMAWEHLPVALYPDNLGYIFSGSAVIDWANTSGFGNGDTPPMVAIYTYHNDSLIKTGSEKFQYQGIAYSLDKGRTWTKHANNPVLENPGIIDFRDPKVFWQKATNKWVMILAAKDHVSLYSSPDLKQWQFESDFGVDLGAHGGVWECPDLFELSVPDEQSRWVMLVSINPGGPQSGSATQYFVGDFNGSVFTSVDTITRWVDLGADNYAGVTWSDVPQKDNRRLFMGWMSNWNYAQVVPTTAWRSAMTLPRELLLKKIGDEYVLQSKPIQEISKYLSPMRVAKTDNTYIIENDLAYLALTDLAPGDLALEIYNANGERVVLEISADSIAFDRSSSGLVDFEGSFGARHAYVNFLPDVKSVGIYIDRSSIEVFINDGEFTITELVFPTAPYNKVKVLKGDAQIAVSKVKSIWGND